MTLDNAVVHLIDDDEAVRKSLAFLLARAGVAVHVYESADKFLGAVDTVRHGCIVTDVRMPGTDGLELQRRLSKLGIALPVIVMTGNADVPLAVEAMKAGAVDFIEKPFDGERLLSAIRTALDRYGKSNQREATELRAKVATLSVRECQVLEGLLAGSVNKAIARDLDLSPRTVEVYRANVMTKMGASSLSELLRMALTAKSASNG
jgi:two-component system response regulator FixJ